MNYTESIEKIANRVLENFDQVYHSVEIIQNDNGERIPAYSVGDEYKDVVFSDTQETVYIRRNGDDEVQEELKLSSCSKSYRMRTPLRIVYSKDHEKNHAEIIFKLMQSILIGGTKLKGIVRDKWKLVKDESSAKLNLGATSAYFAIDIYILWELMSDTCENDFCLTIENPLIKCPVVV
jgi:hypothetical protein